MAIFTTPFVYYLNNIEKKNEFYRTETTPILSIKSRGKENMSKILGGCRKFFQKRLNSGHVHDPEFLTGNKYSCYLNFRKKLECYPRKRKISEKVMPSVF